MIKKERISFFQLFALLYTCRLLTVVTFSPTLNDGELNGNYLPDIFFFIVFLLLMIIPEALFIKKFSGFTPVSLIKEQSYFFSKAAALFYSLVLLFFASVSVSRFYIFTTSVIFPEKNMSFLLVISILVCAYSAFLGLEATARGNIVLLFIIIIGIVSILFFVRNEMSLYNFEPIYSDSVGSYLKSGFFAALRTVEATLLMFLVPKCSGKAKKSAAFWLLFFFFSLSVLFVFLNGVSGLFAETQLFPFYSLAVIARFPFFDRLDAVITAVFIFSILVKTSLIFYVSTELLNGVLSKDRKVNLLLCSALVSVLSLALSLNLGAHKAANSPHILGGLTLFTTVIIPSVLIIKFKGKKV